MLDIFHSCPILSNRFHPTKQHSICCRSENCISLERSGQSAVDSIDSFDLSNGKVYYRFDKCGRRSDNCIPILSNRVHPTKQHSICCRSENCISLERSGQSAVDSIDSFDLSNGKVHYRFDQLLSSIGQLHLISDNGDPVQDCRIDRFVRLVGTVISFTIPH